WLHDNGRMVTRTVVPGIDLSVMGLLYKRQVTSPFLFFSLSYSSLCELSVDGSLILVYS
ncbi:hypothetical protein L9F63_000233, partial [Diploptera punctata]